MRQVVYGLTVGLLLIGLFYAGYVNQLLKGAISDVNRGVVVVGFMVGVAAASSYVGVGLAKMLSPKRRSTRRR